MTDANPRRRRATVRHQPPAAGALAAGFAGGLGMVVAAGMVAFAVRERSDGPYDRARPARTPPAWEVEARPQRVR